MWLNIIFPQKGKQWGDMSIQINLKLGLCSMTPKLLTNFVQSLKLDSVKCGFINRVSFNLVINHESLGTDIVQKLLQRWNVVIIIILMPISKADNNVKVKERHPWRAKSQKITGWQNADNGVERVYEKSSTGYHEESKR